MAILGVYRSQKFNGIYAAMGLAFATSAVGLVFVAIRNLIEGRRKDREMHEALHFNRNIRH